MKKELPKVYEPREVEGRVYEMWEKNGCFEGHRDPDKRPFTIVMPPPNVTGQLHMGHAMDCTLQDILIRFKRMQGYAALWVPGTDHAGIATQIKVEEELRTKEGLTRYDLGREKFLERVWDWKHKCGDRIVKQQKKMGVSCDWDRARFTMIRSRCVRLDLKVVDDGLVKEYLMEHLHVPDYQAEIDASYAQGSIGKAKEAATSQEFADMTANALKILKYANTMEVYELTEAIKTLTADKNNINDYLDIFQFWFRDVLMFKATREIDNLVFKQEINFIREQASERSYENIEKILEALEKTKVRLRANVNLELALELLFLTIREK